MHYVMHDCGFKNVFFFFCHAILEKGTKRPFATVLLPFQVSDVYPLKYVATFMCVLESFEFPEALKHNKQHAI